MIVFPRPVQALEKVSLQLKWLHQFQFAGYYVALEKGFYRDAGLDVEIRRRFKRAGSARERVESGRALSPVSAPSGAHRHASMHCA
jgi:ABC-type nitrate/sulfonate/bicarbonate transport system substrate-binding protein